MNPAILMQILQALSQQGGGQSGQMQPIPTSRVGISPAIMPLGQMPAPPQSSAATPPFMPQQGGPAPTNPLMQMATQQMTNPMGQTIPSPPGQQPSTQGSTHPLLQKILQGITSGLGAGMQGYGYGSMTGPQQAQSQELAASKAEAMGRLAETQRQQDMMNQVYGMRNTISQENVDVNQKKATTAEEKVKAYEELGDQRNAITEAANSWKKDIAEGRLDQGYAKMKQQADQFEQNLSQKKDLFQQDLAYKKQVLDATLPIKEGMLQVAQTMVQQKGTEAGMQAQQKLTEFQLQHPILSQIMGLPDVASMVQGAQGAGIPGAGSPSPQPTPTTGAPMVGAPPVPNPTRPTPQAKAGAKGSSSAPKTPEDAAKAGWVLKQGPKGYGYYPPNAQ